MSFGLALKTFFRVLGDRDFAQRVRGLSDVPDTPVPAVAAPVSAAKPEAKAGRSDALTLIAELQREARFVDFLMEPIGEYTDAQIGAAARDVHKNAEAVIRRIFDPAPLRMEPENSSIEVPVGFEPLEFRFSGETPEKPPFEGTVRHHGWKASRCDMPEWTGPARALSVICPVEVEVRPG